MFHLKRWYLIIPLIGIFTDAPLHRKIENFVRTKYESKRWVMDGPMPDPATLSDGEDEEVVSKPM